jgi:hypothetical protein
MGLFKEIKDALLFSDTQVINSNSLTRSPVDNVINELSVNPRTKTINGKEYIRFGSSDDVPNILLTLIGKSATHAGIISKKAKMIAGESLKYTGNGTTGGGSKATEWKVFSENAGGQNKSLDDVFKLASYIYYGYGGVGYLIKFSKKNVIVGISVVNPMNFRLGLPDANGVIKDVVIADTFKMQTGKVFTGKSRVVPMYDKDSSAKEQFYYVKNPESDNPFYGVPNYIGAFNFIEADYEFGVTINNSASNGFSPKVLATFIGRNMSDADKKDFSDKFKENFVGSDKETVVTSWVRRKEDMPEFKNLDITNLDRTIDTMSTLNDSKILTAHSVTVPTLFGVVMPSKLGVSGSELRDGYSILMSSDIVPTRMQLLKPLQYILLNSQFNKIKIDVVDTPLTIFENRGGTAATKGSQTVAKTSTNG